MRLGAYILLLFSIALAMYYLGSQPIINVFNLKGSEVLKITCETGNPFCSDSTVIIGAILVTVGLAGIFVTFMTGYASMYVIPIIVLIAVLNFFVFPLSILLSPATPDLLKVPVLMFFNILTVLAVLHFIRGGV